MLSLLKSATQLSWLEYGLSCCRLDLIFWCRRWTESRFSVTSTRGSTFLKFILSVIVIFSALWTRSLSMILWIRSMGCGAGSIPYGKKYSASVWGSLPTQHRKYFEYLLSFNSNSGVESQKRLSDSTCFSQSLLKMAIWLFTLLCIRVKARLAICRDIWLSVGSWVLNYC